MKVFLDCGMPRESAGGQPPASLMGGQARLAIRPVRCWLPAGCRVRVQGRSLRYLTLGSMGLAVRRARRRVVSGDHL
jgi:hypothetical protein